MFRALVDDTLTRLRRLAPLVAVAMCAGLALPVVVASVAGAAHRAGGRPAVSLAAPAEAAPAPGATASPVGPVAAPPDTSGVRLPVLFGPAGGAAAPPRAGSSLEAPSAGLDVGVVDYTDCTGGTPMTRASAVHFTCTPAEVTAFVGHNPGVFTPLLRTHTGDTVYYRHDGVQDAYVIRSQQEVSPQQAAAYTQDGSYTHAVFATCAKPDSSAYWVFLADPLGAAAASGGGARTGPGSGTAPAPSSTPRPVPSPSPSPSPTPQGPLPITLPPPPEPAP